MAKREKIKKTVRTIELKTFEFSENNSGGHWRLKKKDYKAMMKAGWKYVASDYDKEKGYDKEPFMKGDPRDDVPYGWRHNMQILCKTEAEAISAFETSTGHGIDEGGCDTCGEPFYISER